MSLLTRCLGLFVVLAITGEAAAQNGLLPLVRKEKPSITDLVLIYQGGTHRIPWKTEHFAPYVSHVDPKTEKEKFAGGDFTTTIEAYIPFSGRAIQVRHMCDLAPNDCVWG